MKILFKSIVTKRAENVSNSIKSTKAYIYLSVYCVLKTADSHGSTGDVSQTVSHFNETETTHG